MNRHGQTVKNVVNSQVGLPSLLMRSPGPAHVVPGPQSGTVGAGHGFKAVGRNTETPN